MIVDTGILYALADRDDRHHSAARRVLGASDIRVVPEPVVAETDWLILEYLGVDAEIAFLRSLTDGSLAVECPFRQDRQRAAEVAAQYRDLRIGYVDGISAAIAERLGEAVIATVDRRHFSALRPRHTEAFELVP